MIPDSILKIIKGAVKVSDGKVKIISREKLGTVLMDKLVWKAVFGDGNEKAAARWLIWEIAQEVGIRPASIHDFYMARGREELPLNFTVPAMNLRGMAYDMARAVFSQVVKHKVGAFILEIARSEIGYTDQAPAEYTAVMLGAALREGYKGSVFIQGDHFQTKESEKPGEPKEGEAAALKKLIKDAVEAGFYNIDIDTSTLVDLTRNKEKEQQKNNVKYSLLFTKLIREVEAKGVTISIGGEIGHIGGKNSTVADFEAYMDGYNLKLPKKTAGISKISVQTGTSHGGVVLPDGTLADVDVDFKVLKDISDVGREKYKIGGAVQHGASTLADEFFSEFTKAGAVEVHLATGFQNMMMDHPQFPKKLLAEIYAWLDREKSDERKEGWTDDQFHYKTRKKAWGKFKKECWSLESGKRAVIRKSLMKRFEFMFRKLNVTGSRRMVDKYVKPVEIRKSLEDFSGERKIKETKGLAD